MMVDIYHKVKDSREQRLRRKSNEIAVGRIIVSLWQGFKLAIYAGVAVLALIAGLYMLCMLGYCILFMGANMFA
jgi:hypothetical protein